MEVMEVYARKHNGNGSLGRGVSVLVFVEHSQHRASFKNYTVRHALCAFGAENGHLRVVNGVEER